MASSRNRSAYLKKIELESFVQRYLPHVWLLTLTFAENLTDKHEAQKRFKPISDWLDRRGIEWNGVWQQQKRGAWHLHILINKYVSIGEFRAFAVKRGWGTFINLRGVGQAGGNTDFQDAAKLISYLCRYLTRSYTIDVPARVRLSAGKSVTKRGNTNFKWVNGIGRVWRAGCTAMAGKRIYNRKSWGEYWSLPRFSDVEAQQVVWRAGCLVTGYDFQELMHWLNKGPCRLEWMNHSVYDDGGGGGVLAVASSA